MSCAGCGKKALADALAVSDRRAVCRACEHAEVRRMDGKATVTTRSRCAACGCLIMSLIAYEGGRCPIAKW